MERKAETISDQASVLTDLEKDRNLNNVLKFKKRMLQWSNPVEYVNNMYGSHPDDDDGGEYFKVVFSK